VTLREDGNTIITDGQVKEKPFVEKPGAVRIIMCIYSTSETAVDLVRL